jgi:hypothetical protein
VLESLLDWDYIGGAKAFGVAGRLDSDMIVLCDYCEAGFGSHSLVPAWSPSHVAEPSTEVGSQGFVDIGTEYNKWTLELFGCDPACRLQTADCRLQAAGRATATSPKTKLKGGN